MEKLFPFSEAPDTAVFTCCHVLSGERPVLYVSHDEDGYWQFLCGEEHEESDAGMVALHSIYMSDKSVGLLAELECRYSAERENVESKWVIIEDT